MANSVDPDQMPCYVASDLGRHCLQRPICSILRIIKVSTLGTIPIFQVRGLSDEDAGCFTNGSK